MSDDDQARGQHPSEGGDHDETRSPDRDDILSMLAETTDAIDQLSQDMATWHEHQAGLQDSLQALIQRLEHSHSDDQLSDNELSQAIANLIRTLDQRLGAVDVEQRFAQMEQRLERLRRDIQSSHSDLRYVKEKMQVSYGILITVPALLLICILLWLWLS